MDRGVSSPMEALARMGNGQYAYIDSLADSDQLFAGQVSGSIITIARDVTVEVDFNPSHVDAYRLIGYEAGIKATLGRSEGMPLLRSKIQPAGQSITALFELIPTEVANDRTSEGSSFAATNADIRGINVSDIVTVRVYYQHPNGSEAEPIEVPLADKLVPFEEASSDFRFAAAVAGFGQLLRNSQYKGDVTFDWVLSTARMALGHNEGGYRSTFVEMVKLAEAITYFDHPAADG